MIGIEDGGTARMEIRRWSEPRDMAMTLAFFVEHPMKIGRRSSSDCGPSAISLLRSMDGEQKCRDAYLWPDKQHSVRDWLVILPALSLQPTLSG